MRGKLILWAWLGILFFSCKQEKEQSDQLFSLIPAEASGVTFENSLVSKKDWNILEYLYFYNGGGVAAGDINQDGWIDLYFTGNQVSNKLYLNKGNFQFEDITEAAGVGGDGGWSTGVTMADVNGDGLLDIYVCQVADVPGAPGQNKFYLNLGEGKFKEAASEFGLDFKGYSTHAAFFDYDRDGDLDVYLLNHNVKSPEVFTKAENRTTPDPSGDKLYRNLLVEGGKGFEDVTEEAGIYSSILGFGLGIAVEDFDGDGWLDLYVSNDFTENDYLYLNNQNGTFRESLQQLIPNTSRYSMGNDAADLNRDGLPDIFTTDMLPEDPTIWMKSVGEDKAEVYQIKEAFGYGDQYVRNHLQLNQGKAGFAEVALFAGVYASDWSWSPLIFDMDNDGLADIHVSNGIAKRPNDLDFIQYSQEVDIKIPWDKLRQKQIEMLPKLEISNFAWKNMGDLRFENQAKQLGLDQPGYSNGSTYADLDNDGDLDLILNNIDQPAFLYQNQTEKTGNAFLSVSLKGLGSNSFGLGSQVTVYTSETQLTQRLSTSRGFQSGTSTQLVFGLGKASAVDSIQVRWTDGTWETFTGLKINSTVILTRGNGPQKPDEPSKLQPYPEDFPKIDWLHQEKNGVDFLKREYLAPKSFTRQGPALAIGDVNRDGLDDLYLGGALDQAGTLLLQKPDGSFEEISNPIFNQLAKAEDTVAEFADLNGDGFLDLVVGSGGNEHPSGDLFNFDRIFLGNGTGSFVFSMTSLPPIGENTSTLAIDDVDGDGDLDLFVGAAVVTGDYGASPKSSLLINDGRGKFSDQTAAWFGNEIKFGMVNSAKFGDLTGNGKKELILSGDWNPIRVFKFENNKAQEIPLPGLEKSAGWINSLELADLDQNGKVDILIGNLGTNSKLKANPDKPVWLYHHDFDGNGQADPLIFHYQGGKLVPFGTRDDLIRQIPGLKRKHTSYSAYAEISNPEDLFTAEELQQAQKLPAYEFRSGVYFQEENGSFRFIPFPDPVQWSPVLDISYDQESQKIALVGNSRDLRVDLGKSMNTYPFLFQWKNGNWIEMTTKHWTEPRSEIRQTGRIRLRNNTLFLGVENNGPVHWIY